MLTCFAVDKSANVDGQLQGELVGINLPDQRLNVAQLIGFVIHRHMHTAHDGHSQLAQVGAHGVFVVAAESLHTRFGVQQQTPTIPVNGWQLSLTHVWFKKYPKSKH